MSGEPEQFVSGWTTDTLHQHIQQRIDIEKELIDARLESLRELVDERAELTDKALSAAMASQQKALENVAATTADRFAGVNEFRGTLADQQKTLATREEVDSHLAAITARITTLESRADKIEGSRTGLDREREVKRSQSQLVIASLGVIVAVVLGIVAFQIGSNSSKTNEVISVPAVVTTTTATR